MRRVAFALVSALAVAGCSSLPTGWLPSMSLGGGVGLKLESEPPGAEAVTSVGPGCRTPCVVSVPPRDELSVTFNLPGYLPQTIPVQLRGPGAGTDSEFASVAELTPNPVFAQLEPAPPTPAKRKAKPKPRTAAKTPGGASSGTSTSAPSQRAIPGSQPTVPPSQRTIPGAQPTAPPASAWPPPTR
jgi:hypothetical protein